LIKTATIKRKALLTMHGGKRGSFLFI